MRYEREIQGVEDGRISVLFNTKVSDALVRIYPLCISCGHYKIIYVALVTESKEGEDVNAQTQHFIML